MRLTKFNEETGQYEFHKAAKTQAEFNEQRKAVIQRLGEFEDKASDVAEEIFAEIEKMLLDNHIGHYKTTIDTWCYNFNHEIISEIAELKKKYTDQKGEGK